MTTTNIDAKAADHGLTLMKWAGLDAGVDRISPATIVSTALADENAFRAGARALAELDSTRAELAAVREELKAANAAIEYGRDAITSAVETRNLRGLPGQRKAEQPMNRTVSIQIPTWTAAKVEIPEVCPNPECAKSLSSPADLFAHARVIDICVVRVTDDGSLKPYAIGETHSRTAIVTGYGCDHCGHLFPVEGAAQ